LFAAAAKIVADNEFYYRQQILLQTKNSIAKVTNSTANGTNFAAKVTNFTANQMKSITKPVNTTRVHFFCKQSHATVGMTQPDAF